MKEKTTQTPSLSIKQIISLASAAIAQDKHSRGNIMMQKPKAKQTLQQDIFTHNFPHRGKYTKGIEQMKKDTQIMPRHQYPEA